MKQQIVLLAAMAALGIVSGDRGQSIGAESAQADPATSFFVSSTGSKTANLGGLRGADKICQQLASAVGLGNKTWHAYLSAERDPDNGNKKPIGVAEKPPKFPVREMWSELGMVKVPTMLVRGLRSDRFPPATVDRFTKEYPHIPQMTVDSQHDIPGQAPDAFVAHVKKFIEAA